MKEKEQLIYEFQKVTPKFGDEILKLISSKTNVGKLFPPYIPFIGKKYENFKIMFYATAQNIGFDGFREHYANNFNKLNERLYFFDHFKKKYPSDKMSYKDIAITPYKTGVIPALLGVYLYAKYGKTIENLDEINDLIGISNYYKFSLKKGNSDINPDAEIEKFINDNKQINYYWQVNDELVKKEIETLKPNIIFSFKGRKFSKLKQLVGNKCQVIEINDPSWILRGGSGVFKENKSWWKKAKDCKDNTIIELVNKYMDSITGDYEIKNKKKYVKIYLLKYYSDWKK